MPMSEKKRAYWLDAIRRQKKWIEACGGDLEGYIENYGAEDLLGRFGILGGESLYRIDTQALARLEAKLKGEKK